MQDEELQKAKDEWLSIENCPWYSDEQKRIARETYYGMLAFKTSPASDSDDLFVRLLTHPFMILLMILGMIQIGLVAFFKFWKENFCTGTMIVLFTAELIIGVVWFFRHFQQQERKMFILVVLLLMAGCLCLLLGGILPSLLFLIPTAFLICRNPCFRSALSHFQDLKYKKTIIAVYGGTLAGLLLCIFL